MQGFKKAFPHRDLNNLNDFLYYLRLGNKGEKVLIKARDLEGKTYEESFVYGEERDPIFGSSPNVTVIGDKTKGGTGQVIEIKLSNGNIFKLTIKRNKDDKGMDINNVGVEPDIYFEEIEGSDMDKKIIDVIKKIYSSY
ncbi:MAG: hypothetical protein GX219_09445 [Tissierellia bacterium]|nr:hypothetical protein [Tissierellia bacterium]